MEVPEAVPFPTVARKQAFPEEQEGGRLNVGFKKAWVHGTTALGTFWIVKSDKLTPEPLPQTSAELYRYLRKNQKPMFVTVGIYLN